MAIEQMELVRETSALASTASRDRIKAFVERVERLEGDKAETAEDIKQVFAEANGEGFDVKALKHVIRLRKIAADERRQMEELVELYMEAVGEPQQGLLI